MMDGQMEGRTDRGSDWQRDNYMLSLREAKKFKVCDPDFKSAAVSI